MIKRTLIGISLLAGLSAMAETNLHLERCSAHQLGLQDNLAKWQTVAQEDVTSKEQRLTLHREILASKLDCLYRILSEQIGGDDTTVFEAVKSGKFKTGMEAMKNARLDILREAQVDQIHKACGEEIKDLFGDKCVMRNSDAAVVDLLATSDAIKELILPRMMPVPTANLTLSQQREGHVGLVKMNAKSAK
jgi:hypothetical protein